MLVTWPVAKLRSHLTAIIVLSCAPLALLMAWHAVHELRDREERLLRSLQEGSRTLAARVEGELSASADLLETLAAGGLLPQPAAADGRNGDARLRRASWHSVFVEDAQPAAASGAPGGEAAPPSRGRRVSAVLAGPDGEPAVRVSVDAGGGRRLGAWIKRRHWQELMTAATPAQAPDSGGFVNLLDDRQRVIAGTPGANAVPRRASPGAVAAAGAAAAGAARVAQGNDGEAAYAAWQQLGFGGWSVELGVPAAPFDRAAQEVLLTLLGAAAASLLLGVSLALGLARRVAQALAALVRGDAAEPRSPVCEVAELQAALADTRRRDLATAQQLQVQGEELDAVFENSPVAMAVCLDAECRVGRHNRAMRGLLGTWNSPLPEILRDGHRLEAAQRALRVAASRGVPVPSHEQEWRFGAPVGSRWVLVQAEPLLDAAGRPRGAVEAVVDITPFKRALQGLAQTRDRLLQAQHLIDAAQLAGRIGFFRYDFASDELYTTRGHAALFNTGDDAARFDGSGYATLFSHGAAAAPQTLAGWLRQLGRADRATMQRAIAEMAAQHKVTHELQFVLPDGDTTRHVSARLLMRFDRTGAPAELMGVVVDTTEHQRAADSGSRLFAAEQRARAEAEAASTAKDDLLAMLGHELRNPLNALSAAAEVLKSLLPPGDALACEAREVVERQARQLTHLTNEFLDLSRVTSEAAQLDLQPTNMHAAAAVMADELRPLAAAGGRSIEIHGSAGWIRADADRLRQMLRKLFDHALLRAGAGGSVRVHVHPEGRSVLLRLGWELRTDETAAAGGGGGGVSAAAAEVSTLDDDQAPAPKTEPHGGMTLGLEWASALARRHGARLVWQQTAGGAEVAARFDGLPALAHTATVVPLARAPATEPRTLLLVEDNEDAAQSLSAALRLEGHRVTRAADGLQGLSVLLAERPEVAIVDMGLPGLGGLAVARQARGAGYSGRLIALSGTVSEEGTAQALRAGFDAFVAKPADIGRLNALISSPG